MTQTPRDRTRYSKPGYWPKVQAAFADKLTPAPPAHSSFATDIWLTDRFEFLLARYSAGDPVAQIALSARQLLGHDLPAFVAAFPPANGAPGSERPSHDIILRQASLLYLCRPTRAEAQAFVTMVALWEDAKPAELLHHDPVLARLLTALAPDIPQIFGPSVVWPEAYADLWQALNPATGQHLRRPALGAFLRGWYEQMASEGSAQSGRLQPQNLSYVGHWCLEAAAAAVILGLADAGWRDHPNYPADLADFARKTPNPD